MGPIEARLRSKISTALLPAELAIENESHQHSVPKNSETHFRAVVVSDRFTGQSRVERQRIVLSAIAEEISGGVHAFTMRCLTPDEFKAGGADGFVSPACFGGSKQK